MCTPVGGFGTNRHENTFCVKILTTSASAFRMRRILDLAEFYFADTLWADLPLRGVQSPVRSSRVRGISESPFYFFPLHSGSFFNVVLEPAQPGPGLGRAGLCRNFSLTAQSPGRASPLQLPGHQYATFKLYPSFRSVTLSRLASSAAYLPSSLSSSCGRIGLVR